MKKTIKEEEIILESISDVYIFVLLLIFPFVVDSTGYFRILECKWYSYIIIACTYLVTCIFTFLYFLIFKRINYLKKIKLTKIQWAAIALLGIHLLSCLLSPFKYDYNLLVGIGRGEGLLVTSLYIFTFLFISLFAKFKKRHILYFSISSIIMSTIAVLQYIGFNPFHLFQNGIGTHNVSFMTTIGNIDFVSALYCIQ